MQIIERLIQNMRHVLFSSDYGQPLAGKQQGEPKVDVIDPTINEIIDEINQRRESERRIEIEQKREAAVLLERHLYAEQVIEAAERPLHAQRKQQAKEFYDASGVHPQLHRLFDMLIKEKQGADFTDDPRYKIQMGDSHRFLGFRRKDEDSFMHELRWGYTSSESFSSYRYRRGESSTADGITTRTHENKFLAVEACFDGTITVHAAPDASSELSQDMWMGNPEVLGRALGKAYLNPGIYSYSNSFEHHPDPGGE